jgi:hypothetical protein
MENSPLSFCFKQSAREQVKQLIATLAIDRFALSGIKSSEVNFGQRMLKGGRPLPPQPNACCIRWRKEEGK